MMSNKAFHIVIRFSDNLFGVGDVVAKHNEIVARNGYVWFGKIGNPLSVNRVDLLNEQISQGVPTNIYLVKGNRKKSTVYCAPLLAVTRNLHGQEVAEIPSYYSDKDLIQYMKVWFKVGEIASVEMSDMSNLRALNSVYPIRETLVRSSSGYFLVHEAKNTY